MFFGLCHLPIDLEGLLHLDRKTSWKQKDAIDDSLKEAKRNDNCAQAVLVIH